MTCVRAHTQTHTIARSITYLRSRIPLAHADKLDSACQIRLRQFSKGLLQRHFMIPAGIQTEFLRHPTILRIIMMCNNSSICEPYGSRGAESSPFSF